MAESNGNLKQTLKDWLIEQFQSWPLGTRLPSIRALAAEHDIAYLTVDSAMRELEWEGYVRRVPRKGTFLASRERTITRDIETGTRPLETILFAYPEFFSYATWIRLYHAEEQAVRRAMALLEFKLHPETSYDRLADVLDRRDDIVGAIVIPIPGSVTERAIATFDDLDIPLAVLTVSDYVTQARRVWAVSTDWHRCGYMQARELIEAGHERIAFVLHEPRSDDRQNEALKGMRQALREAGRKQRDLVTVSEATRPWDDSRQSAYHLVRDLLDDGTVTAAMVESLHGVQGALRAIRESDLSCPEDFALVSIGRGNGDEDYTYPPVTTVDPQPEAELALAFECLLQPEAHPERQRTVPPALTRRDSVAVELTPELPGDH